MVLRAHDVFEILSRQLDRHTGMRVSPSDLKAHLHRDLRVDWMTAGVVLWDVARDLGLTNLAERMRGRSLHDFATLGDLVEFVSVEAGRSATPAPSLRNGYSHSARPDATENGAKPLNGFTHQHVGRPIRALHSNGSSHATNGSHHAPPEVGHFTNGASQAANGNAEATVAGLPGMPLRDFVEVGFPMPVVVCAGTPYEMGLQYGRNQAQNICRIVTRNVELLGIARLKVMPELQDAIADPRIYFGPDEVEEVRGITDGIGSDILCWEFFLGHQLGFYPDFVPGCSQFAVGARRNPEFGLVHAVNEDQPGSLRLREDMTRVIAVRVPNSGQPHITFSISGQIGGMNGLNSAGLAVSSTLLLDRPRRKENEHGTLHPVLIKRILERAATVPEALDVIRDSSRSGGFSICLSHWPTDRICYVEYDGTSSLEVLDHRESLVSTNHGQLHRPMIPVEQHSRNRLERLHSLLNLDSNRGLSPAWARAILRDQYDLSRKRETAFPTMHTIRRVDNQGSIVMHPAAGELWATAGPMAPTMADRFFRISLSAIFEQLVPAVQSRRQLDGSRVEGGGLKVQSFAPSKDQPVASHVQP